MTANPTSVPEWRSAVQMADLEETDTMMLSNIGFRSASHLMQVQFLLFRVLWTGDTEIPLSRFFPSDIIEQAKETLRHDREWNEYLEHLPQHGRDRTSLQSNLGMFKLVRWQQLAISAVRSEDGAEVSSITPTKHLLERLPQSERAVAERAYFLRAQPVMNYRQAGSSESSSGDDSATSNYEPQSEGSGSSPDNDKSQGKLKGLLEPADDEEIVNVALVSLLDAITLTLPGNALEATPERKRFRYGDLWTAVTDGYLRTLGERHSVRALIEVKAATRDRKRTSIQWQEAGEMVAWMFADVNDIGEQKVLGGSGYWRLLIAQDRDEIWIVIAEYGDLYKDYIRDKLSSIGTGLGFFNKMTEYGPFRITQKGQMRDFAVFIQAFCLLQAQRAPEGSGRDMFDHAGQSSRQGDGFFTERLQGLSLRTKTPSPPSDSTSSDESPLVRR